MAGNPTRMRQPPRKEADGSLETLDDATLLQRIAANDEAAFECLFRRYYRRLLQFLLRITRRAELAEEVLSDTMMTVWEKASTFAGRSRASTWITGIAYHKAIKRLAQLGRHDEVMVTGDGELASASLPDLLETTVVADDLGQHLHRALAALSPAHRAVVELTYFHGYSYPEIAALTDCPVNTVKTRMFHARSKLRAILESIGLHRDSDH